MRPALREIPTDLGGQARARLGRRLENFVQAALWAAALGALLTVLLQSLLAADLRGGRLDVGLFESAWGSSVGRWQLVRLPLVAALAVILAGRVRTSALADDKSRRSLWWFLWMFLSVALLGTNSMAGHAASSSPLALTLINDLVHLIAGATWFTGVVVLATVLPRGTSRMGSRERLQVGAPMISRFSDVALASIAIVAGTGTFNSLVNVARADDLIDSGYGRALAIKLLLFLGVLALGATNHFFVRRRLERSLIDAEATRMQAVFRRTIAIELALALGLMGVTGVLVGSERTREQAVGSGELTQSAL
ncbi:MAG: CopD family protein [Actinomycetota bacterium]|nr:CopD family protein [Actinomycetota bacterium]